MTRHDTASNSSASNSAPSAAVNDQDWIGRQQRVADQLDSSLVARLAALFGCAPPQAGEPLPWLWHWAFFQAPVAESGLGEDGHPEDDGFLPPRGGRQRMWAGGEVTFHHPLIVGRPATRRSTLESVESKQGSSGALTFLRVRHDYFQATDGTQSADETAGSPATTDDALAISEIQNVLYRTPAPPRLDEGDVPETAQWQTAITPTPTLLFRYSAATFNGHRIHYDVPYAAQREGYPGLVVHGPMIATLMLDAFLQAHPEARPRRLRYRGERPLIAPVPFEVAGRLVSTGEATLWAAGEHGIAHRARLEFD